MSERLKEATVSKRAPLRAVRPAIIESILQQRMFRRLLHPAGRRRDATGRPSSPRRPAAKLTGQIKTSSVRLAVNMDGAGVRVAAT